MLNRPPLAHAQKRAPAKSNAQRRTKRFKSVHPDTPPESFASMAEMIKKLIISAPSGTPKGESLGDKSFIRVNRDENVLFKSQNVASDETAETRVTLLKTLRSWTSGNMWERFNFSAEVILTLGCLDEELEANLIFDGNCPVLRLKLGMPSQTWQKEVRNTPHMLRTAAWEPVFHFMKRLHDLGFVHGDLKVENVVWDPHDQCFRVIDLGVYAPFGCLHV